MDTDPQAININTNPGTGLDTPNEVRPQPALGGELASGTPSGDSVALASASPLVQDPDEDRATSDEDEPSLNPDVLFVSSGNVTPNRVQARIARARRSTAAGRSRRGRLGCK